VEKAGGQRCKNLRRKAGAHCPIFHASVSQTFSAILSVLSTVSLLAARLLHSGGADSDPADQLLHFMHKNMKQEGKWECSHYQLVTDGPTHNNSIYHASTASHGNKN